MPVTMAKLPALVQEYAKKAKVSTRAWAITGTSKFIMAAGIPDRVQAEQLAAFLTSRGMVPTLSVGDRAGTVWNVWARPALAQGEDPRTKPRRGHLRPRSRE